MGQQQSCSKKREKSESPSSPSNPNENKKQKVSTITDSLSPTPIDVDAPRARRTRKQPVLYDPQICAASEWQSDFQVERALRGELDEKSTTTSTSSSGEDEEENEEENEKDGKDSALSEEQPARTVANASKKKFGKGNTVWCDFCKDDKSISVCCFCACRVCFSKHDEHKLLLCDNCDAEYHIYCLTPRLKEVPKEKWYCPECRDIVDVDSKGPNKEDKKKKINDSNLFCKTIPSNRSKKTVPPIVVRVKVKLLSDRESSNKVDTAENTRVLVKSNRDSKKIEKDIIKPSQFKIQRSSSSQSEAHNNNISSNDKSTTTKETREQQPVQKKKETPNSCLSSSVPTVAHLSRKIPRKSRQVPVSEKINKEFKDLSPIQKQQ